MTTEHEAISTPDKDHCGWCGELKHGCQKKLLDEKDAELNAYMAQITDYHKKLLEQSEKIIGLEKELTLSRSAVRRLREALEKIIEPIPIGNNLPLKNKREDPRGVVYEVKPISIELAKLALQETAIFEAESTKPENLESGK